MYYLHQMMYIDQDAQIDFRASREKKKIPSKRSRMGYNRIIYNIMENKWSF